MKVSVLRDNLLKPMERIIYGEVMASLGTAGFCIVNTEELAEIHGCTDATIKGYLASLEKRGYIRMQLTKNEKLKVVVNEI